MGVAGAGKSTVGTALAELLDYRFVEADDFHSPRNRALLAQGRPLSDQDRMPWLRSVGERLAAPGVVVACSALARTYRNVLKAHAPDLMTVELVVTPEVAASRLETRSDGVIAPDLLDSQFSTLESLADDERGFAVDASGPVDEVVASIRDGLVDAAEAPRPIR